MNSISISSIDSLRQIRSSYGNCFYKTISNSEISNSEVVFTLELEIKNNRLSTIWVCLKNQRADASPQDLWNALRGRVTVQLRLKSDDLKLLEAVNSSFMVCHSYQKNQFFKYPMYEVAWNLIAQGKFEAATKQLNQLAIILPEMGNKEERRLAKEKMHIDPLLKVLENSQKHEALQEYAKGRQLVESWNLYKTNSSVDEELLNQAIKHFEAAKGEVIAAHSHLARLYDWKGLRQEAQEAYNAAPKTFLALKHLTEDPSCSSIENNVKKSYLSREVTFEGDIEAFAFEKCLIDPTISLESLAAEGHLKANLHLFTYYCQRANKGIEGQYRPQHFYFEDGQRALKFLKQAFEISPNHLRASIEKKTRILEAKLTPNACLNKILQIVRKGIYSPEDTFRPTISDYTCDADARQKDFYNLLNHLEKTKLKVIAKKLRKHLYTKSYKKIAELLSPNPRWVGENTLEELKHLAATEMPEAYLFLGQIYYDQFYDPGTTSKSLLEKIRREGGKELAEKFFSKAPPSSTSHCYLSLIALDNKKHDLAINHLKVALQDFHEGALEDFHLIKRAYDQLVTIDAEFAKDPLVISFLEEAKFLEIDETRGDSLML